LNQFQLSVHSSFQYRQEDIDRRLGPGRLGALAVAGLATDMEDAQWQ
jgi:hypothetical protein